MYQQKQAHTKCPRAWVLCIQSSSEDVPVVSFLTSKAQPRTKEKVSVQGKEIPPWRLKSQGSPEHNTPVKPDTNRYILSAAGHKAIPLSTTSTRSWLNKAAVISSLWPGAGTVFIPSTCWQTPIIPGSPAHQRGLRAVAGLRPFPFTLCFLPSQRPGPGIRCSQEKARMVSTWTAHPAGKAGLLLTSFSLFYNYATSQCLNSSSAKQDTTMPIPQKVLQIKPVYKGEGFITLPGTHQAFKRKLLLTVLGIADTW